MKNGAALFLQTIVVLVGIGALALLLWEPQIEGRNAHATIFQIYFDDPFLAYAYAASIPFFAALFQAFRLLAYVRQGKAFSPGAVRAVRIVEYCAVAIIGLVALGEVFILLSPSDDRAGGVFVGLLLVLASGVVAAAAAVFGRILLTGMERAR
jgi:hypothetical protein